MKTDKKPRKTTLSDQLKQVTILSNQLKLTEMAIDAIDLLMGMVQLSRETVYMVLGEPEELKPEEANEMPPLAESLTAQLAAQNEDTDAANKPEKVDPPEAKKATGTCPVCGKEFLKQGKQKYCSPECTKEGKRNQQREYRKKKAIEAATEAKQIEDLTAPLTEHSEKLSIAECQRIDREHGVSYGDGEQLGLHRK